MFKTLAPVAIVISLLAAMPSFAQTTAMNCAAETKKTEAMMMQTNDPDKKDKAMKEITMAKEMAAKNDEKGCMMHNEKAKKALK